MLKRIGRKEQQTCKLTKKVSYPSQVTENYGLFLTLFRMRIFGAAPDGGREGQGVQKGPHFPKICHTYPTMMKIGTVIPYLSRIRKYIQITWRIL